jgi:trehalose synthase
MLPVVALGRHCCSLATNLENYRPLVGDGMTDEIRELARRMNGVRICHLNATSVGGGVAELLTRYIPLLRALGIETDWHLIHGEPDFFTVTKRIHNALQGADYELTDAMRATYLDSNEQAAKLLDTKYDVFVVHDPQPAAIRHYTGPRDAKWIWRCHIDSSSPNPQVSTSILPLIREYDALVFTMREFALPGLEDKPLAIIPPAIDPLATKNTEIPLDLCKRIIADAGVNLKAPLLLQVSRFDPWKDPLGVIEVYRLVKKEMPGVQLVLIGGMAADDPEGWGMLDQVQEIAAHDQDLYVFTNLGGVGSMEVNVFQRGCDVVIQKSLREGFGLVVAEALWKERPVVAGKAGGIPMQFPPGYERHLVLSVNECAARVLELLRHPEDRVAFGLAGREHIRQRYLLPRLLRDELRLIAEVLHI